MKKLLSLICIICVAVASFAGCSGGSLSNSDIEELVANAFKNVKLLKSSDVNSVTDISYDFGTYSYSVKTESDMLQSSIDDASKYEMSSDVSVTSAGSTSDYETFYKNGYYYTTRYGGSFKTKVNMDDTNEFSNSQLINIAFKDMKSVGVNTESSASSDSSGNGQKVTKITFTCKNSVIKDYIEKAFDSTDRPVDDATITTGKGEYVINSDGYIVSESLKIGAKINSDGEETRTEIASTVTYKSIGKKVNPYDPEDADYTEVKDLSNVIELNSAMTNSLYADNSTIKMNMTASITQDKTNAGYKRSYIRNAAFKNEELQQETETQYLSDSEPGSKLISAQYYTGGTYYSRSDLYNQNIYSTMDFNTFYTNIYTSTAKTPCDVYYPGMMKDITTEKSGDDTVYTFGLNPSSDDGVTFLQMLFGPYDQFSGDCSTAKVTVNSFSGKSYVNSKGEYYKTEMSCDLVIKFTEGSVKVKCTQDIELSEINGNVQCKFPSFKNYSEMNQSDILGAYTQSSESAGTAAAN